MKTLTQTLNEAFLFEKTSEVRKYKVFEKNPPALAKAVKYPENNSYSDVGTVFDYLADYCGLDIYGKGDASYELRKKVNELYKQYYNEFIDDNTKVQPVNVTCGMIQDILTNPKKFNIKSTYLLQMCDIIKEKRLF